MKLLKIVLKFENFIILFNFFEKYIYLYLSMILYIEDYYQYIKRDLLDSTHADCSLLEGILQISFYLMEPWRLCVVGDSSCNYD